MIEKTDSPFLNALRCTNSGRTPIWLMRQAGRYLPAYQAIRSQYRLVEMFHSTELVVETTLLPLKLLDVDAAILFADLLTVLDGVGIKWDFLDNVGPVISDFDLQRSLKIFPAEEAYGYLGKAIGQLKKELTIPLIGFGGGPFTLASYLIEGKSSRDLLRTKQLMFTNPTAFHLLLKTLADATIEYLNFQIEAGVDVLQIFDSWAYMLSLHDFRSFCLYYLRYILKGLKNPSIPVILFCRGSCFFAKELASLAPTAIGLDWQGEIADIRTKLPPTVALQGNLDPVALLGSREVIQNEAMRILHAMRGDPGYVFNLGHGILPHTPLDNVKFLVDYVHSNT